ncbi:MAG: large-conductance mechanosensitive channel protein MscL [Hyphomicrobiaceae bacterium]|mgnify:CR=1 FL=1
MGIISEFREFAIKGNMIDMAVGIIMGAAFGGVVTSLVGDVIMPLVGMIVGNADFSSIGPVLSENGGPDGKPIVWAIGKFITVAINFLIVAWVIFMLVKAVNKAKSLASKPQAPAAPPPPPRTEVLLEEIRNALVKK